MNPVIIIPTYACSSRSLKDESIIDTYDHMTPLERQGELARCLSSLKVLDKKVPISILVVSETGIEEQAKEKVVSEISRFANELDITVLGKSEQDYLHSRMVQLGIGDMQNGISLVGYGALRNFGLAYAAVMGYTEAIFIDDNEVIEDPEFIEKACYGLGMLTQSGVPILIKTGYYLDRRGSYKAKNKYKFVDRFWKQHEGFNQWIESAMTGPRLSPSNTACGGCLAIHREALRRVSFDPWIPRGEDLDFLLNVRMYGAEVWFDNAWCLRRLPPVSVKREAIRFRQDIFRWLYENRKLEFSATQIDLLKIPSKSLQPYPAPFLESSISFNIFMTALLRSIGISGQRKGYFSAAITARKGAKEYAKDNCTNYFSFQRRWPEAISLLEGDISIKGVFEAAKVVVQEDLEQSR